MLYAAPHHKFPSHDRGGVDAIDYRDVSRTGSDFEEWIHWFLHTIEVWKTYGEEPHKAPKFTHSCSRYFQPCSFIHLCASTSAEEREQIMANEMIEDMWSPLDE